MTEEFNFYNEDASNVISIATSVISSVASRTPIGAVRRMGFSPSSSL